MVECAKRILGLYHEAQGNNVDNIVPYQSKFQVLLVANFKDGIFIRREGCNTPKFIP
jgi:hypothetical protein